MVIVILTEEIGCHENAQNQTASGHPTLKGWGMLRAARPRARLAGDQKSSSLLCPDSRDLQTCDSAFGFPLLRTSSQSFLTRLS